MEPFRFFFSFLKISTSNQYIKKIQGFFFPVKLNPSEKREYGEFDPFRVLIYVNV